MPITYPLGHTAYHHVGADDDLMVPPASSAAPASSTPASSGMLLHGAVQALAAYHGYRRSGGSLGWAVAWAVAARYAWPITAGVAVAQGFGKRGV